MNNSAGRFHVLLRGNSITTRNWNLVVNQEAVPTAYGFIVYYFPFPNVMLYFSFPFNLLCINKKNT
jgi:hypothetical protein